MGFNEWLLAFHNWSYGISKLQLPKTSDPIRIGVLGAADFTPISLFDPIKTHPDAVITAIGARNLDRAQQQARTHGVARAFGSYQEVIELDDLDAIYVPLPIAKHAEWAIKAARAGKHVLVEKPLCSNEAEAREIEKCAKETGKVILEAFHYQFHPANHVLKAIVDGGRYGKLLSISTGLWVVSNYPSSDIRLNYHLGGGAAMDLAYVFSAIQYLVGSDGDYEVMRASPILYSGDKLVDYAMEAEILFKPRDGSKPVSCKALADLRPPRVLGVIPMPKLPSATLEFENAKVTMTNYVAPHSGHDIIIEDKTTGVTTKQKHYAFGPKWGARSEVYWTTYRYQLEAFVAKIRGEEPPHWLELKDSVAHMALIDQIYDKAGLPRRGLDLKYYHKAIELYVERHNSSVSNTHYIHFSDDKEVHDLQKLTTAPSLATALIMATLRSKTPVVLFGYDSSAFTQKIRLALRLKQIPYTFVLVPSMMPRPVLRDNFNITYRKIPIVMLGREAYIDTSLICEALEQHFPPTQQYGTLYPRVSNGTTTTTQRSVIRALASYWTDRALFRQTCGLMPSSVWRSGFGTDRAGLIGHKLDPDKLQAKIPQMMSGLDMHLSMLEALLRENNGTDAKKKWFMGTEQPGLADIAFFYQLDWGREIALGNGVEDLTAGEVRDGGEPGAEQLFRRYPSLEEWYQRTKRYFAGLPTNETRVERGDEDGVAAVLRAVRDSELQNEVPLLPTPATPYKELDNRNGLKTGARITIAPVDTGMNDPSVGTLLAATPEEIVIAPEDIDGRHADVRLHFPRTEFRARPVGNTSSSKL